MTMKKEMIQTRNRKMNKKMIMKHESLEEDWTNNEDWLKSYIFNRSFEGDVLDPSRLLEERKDDTKIEDSSVDDIEEELDDYTKLSGEDKMYENDMIEVDESNILN